MPDAGLSMRAPPAVQEEQLDGHRRDREGARVEVHHRERHERHPKSIPLSTTLLPLLSGFPMPAAPCAAPPRPLCSAGSPAPDCWRCTPRSLPRGSLAAPAITSSAPVALPGWLTSTWLTAAAASSRQPTAAAEAEAAAAAAAEWRLLRYCFRLSPAKPFSVRDGAEPAAFVSSPPGRFVRDARPAEILAGWAVAHNAAAGCSCEQEPAWERLRGERNLCSRPGGVGGGCVSARALRLGSAPCRDGCSAQPPANATCYVDTKWTWPPRHVHASSL
eukprot:269380-Chlamydomonas_euryale.AAC.5